MAGTSKNVQASKRKMSLAVSKKRSRSEQPEAEKKSVLSKKTDNKLKEQKKTAIKTVEEKGEGEKDNEDIAEQSGLDSESGLELASETDSDLEKSQDEDEDDEDEDDDDIPVPQKKQKVSKKQETEQFSNAINALLDTHLKAYDRKDPILARSKKELKTFENDKLEEKAKKLLLAEKKKRLTANRVKDLLPTDDSTARQVLEKEKKLKKIAQKGVIKLFNAILMTQTETEQDISKESGLIGNAKKKELVNEISKEKFLSLVQQAGK